MRSIRSGSFVALVLVLGAGALLTKSWRELGIGVVSAVAAPGTYGGRDVQIAAAEFGVRSH